MREYIKTNKPNTELKITLTYNKGGLNYFNYKTEKRGYYLSVSPIEVERRGDGVTMECYKAFSGYKSLILEVKRQSDKQYKTAIEQIETKKAEMIAEVLRANNLKTGDN